MPRIPALLLLLALVFGCGESHAPQAGPRPDVLLITLDTLRADHLGAWGGAEGTTPTLDALAGKSVVFERMLAASARTAPSHASLFTSRWVRDHGVGYRNGSTRLGDGPTLASRLAEAGYQTAAFVSNSVLRRRLGFDAGFAHYDDQLPDMENNRPVFERVADGTTDRAVAWLSRPRSGPRFVWAQYNDPHGPYTPPEAFLRPPEGEPEPALPALREQRGVGGIPAYQVLGDERDPRAYRARYRGEVRYLDASLGRLLRAFEAQAGPAGVVVALTADHGESFGEEGIWFSHGFATTPDLVHVPFLLQAAGLPPGRVQTPVHHVDVLPTLLDLLGLPIPEDAVGRSLAPVARGDEALPEDRPLYVDVGAEVSVYRGGRFLRARFGEDLGHAPEGSRVLHRWTGPSSWERVDDADPGEALALTELAEAYDRDRAPLLFAEEPDADDVVRLRSLGYLEPEEESEPPSR